MQHVSARRRSGSLFAMLLLSGLLAASSASALQDNPRNAGPGDDDPGNNNNPDTVSDSSAFPGDPDWSDLNLLPTAFHRIQHFEWLGRAVDEEPAALLDDNASGHGNDDDGLFGLGFAGGTVTVRARLTTQQSSHPLAFPAGSLVCVDAWIDWNNDGTFDDLTEFVGTTSVHPPFGGFLGPDSTIVSIAGPAQGSSVPDYNVRLRVDWHDAGNIHTPHAGGEADGNVNPPGLTLKSFGEVEDYEGGDAWYVRCLGKTGTNGVQPHLFGSGPGTPASLNEVTLELAKPNATTALMVGVDLLDVPFKGGTLCPSPDFLTMLTTDAQGRASFPTVLPLVLPAGVKLYAQCWIFDAVSIGDILASSNGLRLLTK